MHNSAICSNREIFKTEQETKTGTPTPKNYASNVLENPVNKKQVRTKILLRFAEELRDTKNYEFFKFENYFYFYISE